MRYRVVGSRPVAGVAPGGVVELDESVNAAALLWGGHIAEEPQMLNDDIEKAIDAGAKGAVESFKKVGKAATEESD